MRLGGGNDSSGHPVGNGIVVESSGDLATVEYTQYGQHILNIIYLHKLIKD